MMALRRIGAIRIPLRMPTPHTLDQLIQVYDEAFDPALCERMIQSFHALERFQKKNGRGVRGGLEESGWTELDITPLSDPGFRGMVYDTMCRYLERYNATLGLTIPIPVAERISELIIKRYRAGTEDNFQPHFDSLGPVCNRYMVFLWYLNDVEEGGETAFLDIGVEMRPKTGRLVMFPPYWMFQHAAKPPVSNDKYILSSYFLF